MPNAAHLALAHFESQFADDFLLVTQNVDGLHQRAGQKNILAMHGELSKARCSSCAHVLEFPEELNENAHCSKCQGKLRPHIVWFGEMPLFLPEIYSALQNCDLFVAIGTSGVVYPAADMVNTVRRNGRGAKTILINLESAENDWCFDKIILGPASKTVPELFKIN